MRGCPPTGAGAAAGRVRLWPIAAVAALLIGVAGWLVRDSDRALAELERPAFGAGGSLPVADEDSTPAPAIRALAGRPGAQADGEAAIPDAIRLALSDADPARRLDAIGELEARADPPAGEMLAQALSDPDVRVRRVAVDALASMPAAAVATPLQRALFDEDATVRLLAVDALADVGGEAILDAMLIALHDRHADVRLAAVETLSDMDEPRARSLLQLALGDGDPAIRAAAADYLGVAGASSGRNR